MKALTRPQILAAMAIKLVIILVFSSEISQGLFREFLNGFLSGQWNPWEYFYHQGPNYSNHFPYPFVMLIITSLFYAPFYWFFGAIAPDWIFNLSFKLPSLIADLGIFYLLVKMFPNRKRGLYWFYFLSPIVMYGIFMHSQLDLIPTFFVVLSLYLLDRGKTLPSALIFGLALSTKAHTLVMLPLILIYIYRKRGLDWQKILSFSTVPFVVYLLQALPFLFTDGYQQMVLSNPRQQSIFQSTLEFGQASIYLPFFAVFFIWCRFLFYKKINRELFFSYAALVFSALLILISPSPAWYVWCIPFLAVFLSDENFGNRKISIVYAAFCVFYLTYFLTQHPSSYVELFAFGSQLSIHPTPNKLSHIVFTLLQCSFAFLLFRFITHGLKSNQFYSTENGLVVGIAGDSSSGKSYLAKQLARLFEWRLTIVEGDAHHKWQRNDENWDRFTHLDPRANYLHQMASDIARLKKGQRISMRQYDHSSGKFTMPERVAANQMICVVGLHVFYLPKMRHITDIKIYVDTDEKLRRHWKIQRDTKKRGHSIDKVIESIEKRMPDFERYIRPQMQHADLIFKLQPKNPLPEDLDEEIRMQDLSLIVTMNADLDVEPILDHLETKGSQYKWYFSDDLQSQVIEFQDNFQDLNFEEMAIEFIPHRDELVGSQAQWSTGIDGLMQFMSIFLMSQKVSQFGEVSE